MKRYIRKLINTAVFAMKMLLYFTLLFIFLFVFSQEIEPVLKLSRTMGTTILTFVIVGLLMVAIYGKFDIGRRKSKPIIYSLSLAAILTDVITYLQLMIMKTIVPDVGAFRFTNVKELIIVMVLQVIVIIIFTYAGNGIYFRLIEPEKCCIITAQGTDLERLSRSVKKYKKQYNVLRVVDYRRTDLLEIVKEMDTVFLYNVPINERAEVMDYCYENLINIYINPEVVDIVENLAEHYLLDDVSMLNFNMEGLSFEQRLIKRIFDIVLATIAIVISSPFWIISAIAIKLGDGGPVFFRQKRATKDGRVFSVYKFRTMKQNVENRSATENDDRITPVGKVLRKTRLDEIPQILNILKGDMSFVGPRPEMLENVYAYTEDLPEFKYRLRVKAGLTGYAQIAGKYNTSPKDKLILDMMYIEKYSFWRDIKLIFQTAIVLLKSDSTEGFKNADDVFVIEETPEELRK